MARVTSRSAAQATNVKQQGRMTAAGASRRFARLLGEEPQARAAARPGAAKALPGGKAAAPGSAPPANKLPAYPVTWRQLEARVDGMPPVQPTIHESASCTDRVLRGWRTAGAQLVANTGHLAVEAGRIWSAVPLDGQNRAVAEGHRQVAAVHAAVLHHLIGNDEKAKNVLRDAEYADVPLPRRLLEGARERIATVWEAAHRGDRRQVAQGISDTLVDILGMQDSDREHKKGNKPEALGSLGLLMTVYGAYVLGAAASLPEAAFFAITSGIATPRAPASPPQVDGWGQTKPPEEDGSKAEC